MKTQRLFIITLLCLILLQTVHADTGPRFDVSTYLYGSSANVASCSGFTIYTNSNITITGIGIATSSGATRVFVYPGNVSSGTGSCSGSQYNGTVSGTTATLGKNVTITAGSLFTVLSDAAGASYAVRYDTSPLTPQNGNSSVLIWKNGVDNAGLFDHFARNVRGVYYTGNVTNASAGSTNTITLTLSNLVNGSSWPNTLTLFNVTGTLTFNYFNITGTGFCVSYTGNGTGTNCTTSGSGQSTFYNVTNASISITGDQTVSAATYQALLNLSAYRLFLNTSIATFNTTNAIFKNTSGTIVYANNGTNNIKIDVAGNYSQNVTCTVPAPLQTVTCNATGIHDNRYSFNATDIWNNLAIQNFTLIITNITLGGTLYNQTTTNGSLNLSLLQGYTYHVQFITPNGSYEYANATLPANASAHHYEFEVLPAPSIDITIRDADDNTIITENITIQLINNASGTTNYTITGGFFSNAITPGTYTIRIESANYSQSIYTVLVNEGSVYFLTAYLQFAPETVVMQYVDSISSSIVLPDTSVSQERIVNGTWQVISSKVTDVTGRTSFRYADDIAYRFTAIKTGYGSKIFTLDPILFSSYTINMERDTALDFDQDFQNVYVGYNPKIFYDGEQNQVNITFSSPTGTFTSYNYTITYPNGTKTGTGINVVGESFTIDFNITGSTYSDRVNITITYDTSIGPPRTYTYQHTIIITPGDNTFIANVNNTYGLGILERLIIGTLIIVIVAGLITIGAGSLWGLGMALFIMGLWISIGFWPWWAAGLSFLVGFALIAGRTN